MFCSSFTILSGVRLPAGLISILLLHHFGRRFTVAGSHVAASLCIIICLPFAGKSLKLWLRPLQTDKISYHWCM